MGNWVLPMFPVNSVTDVPGRSERPNIGLQPTALSEISKRRD